MEPVCVLSWTAMGLNEDRYVGLSIIFCKVILHKTDLGLYLKGGPKYQKRLISYEAMI